MKLIVGLGNIGDKYTKTRHNAGFMAVDFLAEKIASDATTTTTSNTKTNVTEWQEEPKFKAFIAETTIGTDGEKTILAKPTTFMNLSGESIAKIMTFYKIPLENLTVIFDDIDLPLGTIRLREKGSAGTHNGMKSIIKLLGTEDFKRIRIGTESRGITSPKEQDTASFVLSNFTKEEEKLLKKAIEEAIAKIIS